MDGLFGEKDISSDSINIMEIAKGNQNAFAELVRIMTPKLIPVAVYYLQGNAEDAIQEIWLKVWGNRHMLFECEKITSWLAAVTRYHCIDCIRKVGVAGEKRLPLSYDEYINVLSSDDYDPEQCYLEKERADIIIKYVYDVKEIYGLPLKLYYYDEMCVKEIAKLLNVNETTVKWRLYMGRQLIKKIIIKDGYIYGNTTS